MKYFIKHLWNTLHFLQYSNFNYLFKESEFVTNYNLKMLHYPRVANNTQISHISQQEQRRQSVETNFRGVTRRVLLVIKRGR